MTDPRIITALDFPNATEALALAEKLDPALTRVKVGKELFTRAGPDIISALHAKGFEIFLDLKYHDIPNTVAGAVRAAAEMGVWMMNVHASGGERMLQAARQAVDETGHNSLLIAVTVLTSMTDDDLASIGVPHSVTEQVIRLAKITAESGLDGVVCSSLEASDIKQAVQEAPNSNPAAQEVSERNLAPAHSQTKFLTVTPGIRPASLQNTDDQRRTLTPSHAIQNGSDYLVIGRPITAATDPIAALSSINAEINAEINAGN